METMDITSNQKPHLMHAANVTMAFSQAGPTSRALTAFQIVVLP